MTYPRSWRYRCEPAGTVIRALGGARRCAERIGVSTELCSQWNRPANRGGTGGYVPERHWLAILEAARAAGRGHIVTEDLLRTGEKEKADMGMLSRRKGAGFELQVVRDLKKAGLNALRVPLSGAAEGWPGDVVIEGAPTGRWVIQCKISGGGAGGRQTILRALRDVAMCRVVANGGEALVAMRREHFVELVDDRPPRAVNTPEIAIAGRQVLDHLAGHDALVFRRSGSSEWMALVREEKYG